MQQHVFHLDPPKMFYSYPRIEQPKIFPFYQMLSLFSSPIRKLLQQSFLLYLDIHQQKKLGRLVQKKERIKKKEEISSPSVLQISKEKNIPSMSNQRKTRFSSCSLTIVFTLTMFTLCTIYPPPHTYPHHIYI